MAWRHWTLIIVALLSAGCQAAPASGTKAVNAKGPIGVNDPWPTYDRRQPVVVNASGDYVHEGTGLLFPASAGSFVREKIVRYDGDGLDVSANYSLPSTYRQRILVSVYLYPITGTFPGITPAQAAGDDACLAEFQGVETVAMQMFINPKLVTEKAIASPHQDFKPGRMAVFDAAGGRNFKGFTGNIRSESYVFCGHNPLWVLKYRITYEQSLDAQASIGALLAAVPR